MRVVTRRFAVAAVGLVLAAAATCSVAARLCVEAYVPRMAVPERSDPTVRADGWLWWSEATPQSVRRVAVVERSDPTVRAFRGLAPLDPGHPARNTGKMPVARAVVDAGPPVADRCDATNVDLVTRIDASLAAASRFLLDRQSPDGAWRSETYGAFRDGPTLTPYVMSALFYLPQAGPDASAAYRRGVDYLAGFVDRDGRLAVGPRELLFPVYTAASASRVVVLQERSPRNLQAQQAWLAYLRARQLNEALGWSRSDPEYGGWGFSLDVPRKPGPGELRERFFESNLAATIFGLAALRSARVPPDDPAYQEALVFVQRCQNFPDDPARRDPRFDDGGFFFIPGDPVQNKAGTAGTDRFGRPRFHSYGTMTADGLRALLRCGLAPDHPRVVAARRWLEQSFSAEHNPGAFEPDRLVLQDATYYYWTWAVAHAFLALGVQEINAAEGQVDWAPLLAEALLRRQQPDGSWVNRYTDAREDDPLVATPWAAAALAICRSTLTGQRPALSAEYTPSHAPR